MASNQETPPPTIQQSVIGVLVGAGMVLAWVVAIGMKASPYVHLEPSHPTVEEFSQCESQVFLVPKATQPAALALCLRGRGWVYRDYPDFRESYVHADRDIWDWFVDWINDKPLKPKS